MKDTRRPGNRGTPVEGYDAMLSDVAAYVASVNYGSIVKFLAVVDAIHRMTGVPLEELVRFDYLPPNGVEPGDPDAEPRRQAVASMAEDLFNSRLLEEYPILYKKLKAFGVNCDTQDSLTR